MSKLVAIVGGSALVYVVLALLMGVIPGYELSKTPAGPGVRPLTPLEAKGRDIYAANGCGYCHTQQVRPLAEDKVFGRPSAPGDFAYQTPELLGSERTGPDLTDVGVRQASEVWQYMHLYNPRSVMPESIMPSFAWMFRVVSAAPPGVTPVPVPPAFASAQGVVIPTPQVEALVAYVLSLKQSPLPVAAARPGSAATQAPAGAQTSGASGAATGAAGTAAIPGAAAISHGKDVFTTICAACHQATGKGIPGVFPSLAGNAAVNDADPTLHVHTVLFGAQGVVVGGVKYASPMPPLGGQLSDEDIADVIDYERGAWGNHGKLVTVAEVAKVRAAGK
jgi:cytochrome c oxidase cbb3-type subunit II